MSTQEDLGAGASGGAGAQGGMGAQPSEEELRAAYEAELSRISSADMILQSAASLLNIGGLRLGLVREAGGSSSPVKRDLEQVRDAIDAVRALLPILERHGREGPNQLRPLREALSQLQMAYTRELQKETSPPAAEGSVGQPSTGQPPADASPKQPNGPSGREGPGPAESSGRLWVPGR